ncbi:MAG TPA: hypothetical protein VIR33_12815 [Thermopolyspora sp.]
MPPNASPLLLPVRTLYLAGRFLVPLVLWFTVGRLLTLLLLTYGADLSLKWPYFSWAGISLLVMVSLGVTVAMVHSVRTGLSWAYPDEPLLDALGRAILPFMIIYMAWSFFTDDAKTWANAAFDRAQAQGLDFGTQALDAINALSDNLPVALVITAGFWALRVICERWAGTRLPRTGSVLTAFFEINFTLFGLFSVGEIVGRCTGWFTSRRMWSGVAGLAGDAVPDRLAGVLPAVKDAVLGPLIWLTMAGVVLGFAMDREHPWLSRLDRTLAGRLVTQGARDKWVPMVNGLRLIRLGGALTFAVFTVLIVLVDHLHDWGYRWTVEILGPHPYSYWEYARVPLGFSFDLLRQVLRICLLAATFDLVLLRARGDVSGRTAAGAGSSAPMTDPAPPTPAPAAPSPPPMRGSAR